MFAEVVHPHRLEGAGADMQGEPGALRPTLCDAREQRVVEVQAGGGRGDRAGFAGIDRLVARLVGLAGGALDVGRQRQLAVALEQREQVLAGRKAQVEELAHAAEHLDLEGVRQPQPAAGLRRLARAHLGERLVWPDRSLDQHLDLAAAVLDAVQSGVDDAGVVEDEQVAGIDALGEGGEHRVGEPRRGILLRLHHQQAAGAALGQWCLGDQLGGQGVVEVGEGEGHRVVFGGDCSGPAGAVAGDGSLAAPARVRG